MHGRNMEIESAAANPNVLVRFYEVRHHSTGGRILADNGVTWTEFPTRPQKAAEGTIALSADGAILSGHPPTAPPIVHVIKRKTWELCKGLPPTLTRSSPTASPRQTSTPSTTTA